MYVCMNMYIENGQSSSRFRLTFLSLSLYFALSLCVYCIVCRTWPGQVIALLPAWGTRYGAARPRPNWQTGARCSKVSHGGIKRNFFLNLLFFKFIWFQSCFSSCKVILNIVFFGDTFFFIKWTHRAFDYHPSCTPLSRTVANKPSQLFIITIFLRLTIFTYWSVFRPLLSDSFPFSALFYLFFAVVASARSCWCSWLPPRRKGGKGVRGE